MALQQLKQVTIPTGTPDMSDYYTKSEADNKFALKGSSGGSTTVDAYTKSQSDSRYAQKTEVYTRSDADARFALKNESSGGVSTDTGSLSGSSLSNGDTLGSGSASEAGTYLITWYARIGSMPGSAGISASIICDAGSSSYHAQCAIAVGGNGDVTGGAQVCNGWAVVSLSSNESVSFWWQSTGTGGQIVDSRYAITRLGD